MVIGAVLIVLGIIIGGWGWLLAIVGLVFVLVGLFDNCLLAPLFGKPLRGPAFRAKLGR
jgi:hypothetical protein